MNNRFRFKVYFGDPNEETTKRFNELYTSGYITFDGEEISLDGDILDLNEALRDKSLIICQYIGIDDSENNKIYEGDIVEVWTNVNSKKENKRTLIVEYDIDRYVLRDIKTKAIFPLKIFINYRTKKIHKDFYFKVIGNIYENPKLINKEL